METVKVQKTGGGLTLTIPASIARSLGIEKGAVYKLTIETMGKEHKLIYAPMN
jgi:antitoxin component of MazEF toxin-antitoxin module